ncbi:MAG: hypothetical protein JM58_04215 [Peptococcaceae bacterium BICA1-8]|nr:MAG: hypothetical protein JM58_04215 [Peptococcaceae bacterium BICA1-8]
MIIDIRYHVASLVAIFIALALGILIGSTLVGQDFMENMAKEQNIWIGKLEQDYLSLKNETETLRGELVQKQNQLNYYQSFAVKIKPFLLTGKLQGKKFAIIELDQNGPFQDVVSTLEQSGAKIVSSTRLKFSEKTIADYNMTLLTEDLSKLILNGERTELTDLMEETDIIKSIGTYGDLLDGIILVTGFNKDKILIETQNSMTNHLKNKIPLYLISTDETIPIKTSSELCIVDKLDTIPGQVNLILSIFENRSQTVFEANN